MLVVPFHTAPLPGRQQDRGRKQRKPEPEYGSSPCGCSERGGLRAAPPCSVEMGTPMRPTPRPLARGRPASARVVRLVQEGLQDGPEGLRTVVPFQVVVVVEEADDVHQEARPGAVRHVFPGGIDHCRGHVVVEPPAGLDTISSGVGSSTQRR